MFKAREVLGKYSYQLYKKYMASKYFWSKQLFIAVESELQRLLKRYGIKDSKPNEKFIKTVQKSAATKGMTVAEYRDKILFPHGKERIIARFKQYLKLQPEKAEDKSKLPKKSNASAIVMRNFVNKRQ